VARPLLNNYLIKLSNLGYRVAAQVLNAKYYEVASKRERLFVVGIRNDLNVKPSHPKPYQTPKSFNQAVLNVKNKEGEVEYVTKRVAGLKSILAYLKYCKEGEKCDKYTGGKFFSHQRIDGNKPVPTITTSPDLYHPKENRNMTITELKAVSSFPESFQVVGSYAQQYERIGRAVPPNLMKHIANHVIKLISS